MPNVYHVTVEEVWQSTYAVEADNVNEAYRKAHGAHRINCRYDRLLGEPWKVVLAKADGLPARPMGEDEKEHTDAT